MLTFVCPGCGKTYTKDESLAGMQARCKQCGLVFVIPMPHAESFRSMLRPARTSWEFDDDNGSAGGASSSLDLPRQSYRAARPARSSRAARRAASLAYTTLPLGLGACVGHTA